jgi:hypothetical protein
MYYQQHEPGTQDTSGPGSQHRPPGPGPQGLPVTASLRLSAVQCQVSASTGGETVTVRSLQPASGHTKQKWDHHDDKRLVTRRRERVKKGVRGD